jgi:CRP-like cAMP-binding protein
MYTHAVTGADLRKLKDEASAALEKGKHKVALEAYARLARVDGKDPTWPHRAGELARRLGRTGEAVEWLEKGAEGYARQGFLLKAIAVCKMILEVDSAHTATQTLLADLYAKQGFGGAPSQVATSTPGATPAVAVAPMVSRSEALGAAVRAADSPPSTTPPAPRAHRLSAQLPVFLAPGRPLEDLRLGDLIDLDAPASLETESVGPIIELDLDDVLEVGPAEQPGDADTATATLPRVPLFSALEPHILRALIERVTVRQAEAGENILERGTVGDALYVVARGSAAAYAPTADGAEGEVGRLREGDFFGEVALLADVPRSATVRALEATDLIVIGRDLVAGLLGESPAVLSELLRFLRDRLVATVLTTSPLFAPFQEAERQELAGRFRFLEVDKGGVLIEEGRRASGLYVLLCGVADVTRASAPLAELGAGDVCGEMSLLSHEPATATVRARTKLWALCLERAGFQELIVTQPQVLIYVNDLAEARRQANEHARRLVLV